MARYNGKPKASKPDRFEVARCSKELFGVYDNKVLRFIHSNLTESQAKEIKWKLDDTIFDRELFKLYKRCVNI